MQVVAEIVRQPSEKDIVNLEKDYGIFDNDAYLSERKSPPTTHDRKLREAAKPKIIKEANSDTNISSSRYRDYD